MSAVAWVGLGIAAALGVPELWPALVVSPGIWAAALLSGVGDPRTPARLVLAVAIVTPILGGVVPDHISVGLLAGTLTAGPVVFGVFEERRRIPVMVAALTVCGIIVLRQIASDSVLVFFAISYTSGALIGSWLVVSLRQGLQRQAVEIAGGDRRFRDLFDRVPVGLYRTSVSGELLDANQALADILGVPLDSVLGRQVQPFMLDPADLHRLRERLATEGSPLVSDLRFRRADGRIIWVRDRTHMVRDESGEVVCFEGELQDITSEVEHMDRLRELVQSKSELIAAVSHELRTPLTAVVGCLDLLVTGVGDEAEDLLALAAEQAHDLATIVEDLLTAARLDNQELVVHDEVVDIFGAAEATVRSMDWVGVSLGVPPGAVGRGDGSRVRQILRNLVSNASKYGKPPVSVHLEVGEGTVGIVVADHGDPISPDVRRAMFESFYTTGSQGTQPGSIGLGLAISRRLAQRMGGDLHHDRVGEQNRFVLTLPAVEADLAGDSEEDSRRPSDGVGDLDGVGQGAGLLPDSL